MGHLASARRLTAGSPYVTTAEEIAVLRFDLSLSFISLRQFLVLAFRSVFLLRAFVVWGM